MFGVSVAGDGEEDAEDVAKVVDDDRPASGGWGEEGLGVVDFSLELVPNLRYGFDVVLGSV